MSERWPIRRLALAGLLVCVLAALASGSSPAATSSTTVTVSVPSATSVTNQCTQQPAWNLGTILPGSTGLTATNSNVCRIAFQSSNDSAALFVGQVDASGTAMMGGAGTATSATQRAGGLGTEQVATGATSTTAWMSVYNYVAKTTDGGTTWGVATNPPLQTAADLEAADDSLIYGSSDGIVKSTDGGSTWSTVNGHGFTDWWIHLAVVRGTNKLWAVQQGANNYVRYSADQGGTWATQGSGVLTTVSDISAARNDVTAAWAIGDIGGTSRVMRTTDTGATWNLVAGVPNNGSTGITAWSATHAWIWQGVYSKRIQYTTDGGATWQFGTIPFDSGNVHSVTVGSASTLFAVGLQGMAAKSIDGGATWTVLQQPTSATLNGAAAFDANTLYIAGQVGPVSTVDGGSTWRHATSDEPILSASAIDGKHAWAVGGNGQISATVDGSTWSFQTSGTTNLLRGVSAAPGLPPPASVRVWAVGDNGTILTSTNGTSWSAQSSGAPTVSLRDVSAVSATTAFAVGAAGTILVTTNGGTSWSSQISGTTNNLNLIHAVDANNAWAVGEANTILRTTDGGVTWASSATKPPGGSSLNNWEAMAVVSPTEVWVATRTKWNGLYYTTDGGATWIYPPNQVGMTDSLDATPDGTVYESSRWGNASVTHDRGATAWEYLNPPYSSYMTIAAIDANTALTFDIFGSIVKASASATMPDYAAGNNWGTAGAPGLFGACVQALGGSATIDAPWVADTITTPGNCQASTSDPWAPIPASATKVAHTTTAGQSGQVDFVFGVRIATTQPPGTYRAPVAFNVIAPNV